MRTISICGEMPDGFGEAMARFSTWGYPTYTKVSVYPDSSAGEKGLIAIFETEEGHRFVMGAVYDQVSKSYSFHS
jgi:hypothetical protein